MLTTRCIRPIHKLLCDTKSSPHCNEITTECDRHGTMMSLHCGASLVGKWLPSSSNVRRVAAVDSHLCVPTPPPGIYLI